jgi:hypothetical protein
MKIFTFILLLICLEITPSYAQIVKIVPTNLTGTAVRFGQGTFTDGNYLFIGARDDAGLSALSGAAFIYKKSGNNWVQEAKIYSDTGNDGNQFGEALAFMGDYLLVGSSNPKVGNGAAHLFKRSGASWSQVAKVSPSPASGFFGSAVAMNTEYAFISANRENRNTSMIQTGALYVYRRNGDNLTFVSKITSPNQTANGFFGNALSIDGDYLAIAATNDGSTGAVYIYHLVGSTWTLEATVKSSDIAAGDQFGSGIHLKGDQLIVGASTDDDKGMDSGSAYIFKRNGTAWTQIVKFVPTDGDQSDNFGEDVALSGTFAIVSSPIDEEKGNLTGSVYGYKLQGANWVFDKKYFSTDPNQNEIFGFNLHAASNGTVLIGATGNDEKGANMGAAYVLTVGTSSLEEVRKLVSGLELFPVPATDFLTYNWTNDLSNPADQLPARLLDLQGKTVWQGQVNAQFGQVPVAELQSGMYLFEMNAGGIWFGKQFLKK